MGPCKIDRAVAKYAELRPALERATWEMIAHVTAIIDDAGINYLSVTGRTKSIQSFTGKARLLHESHGEVDPMSEITDLVGVRVITYVHGDILAVADLLAEQFTVLQDRDLGKGERRAGRSDRELAGTATGRHRDGRPDARAARLIGRARSGRPRWPSPWGGCGASARRSQRRPVPGAGRS